MTSIMSGWEGKCLLLKRHIFPRKTPSCIPPIKIVTTSMTHIPTFCQKRQSLKPTPGLTCITSKIMRMHPEPKRAQLLWVFLHPSATDPAWPAAGTGRCWQKPISRPAWLAWTNDPCVLVLPALLFTSLFIQWVFVAGNTCKQSPSLQRSYISGKSSKLTR